MKTKLNELLEFPCSFTYKIMGSAVPELTDRVSTVIEQHVADEGYDLKVKSSSKGNYLSVSVTITATHIEQIETLYEELAKIEQVKLVL